MKPQVIFLPVLLVCTLMAVLLPTLAAPAPGGASAQAAISSAAPAGAPVTGAEPTQPPLPVAPSLAPTAEPTQAQVAEPPAPVQNAGPAEAPPVFVTPTGEPVVLQAPYYDESLPDLDSFAAAVSGGPQGQLVGVYAPGAFALPVGEQPNGDEEYVSAEDGQLTRYAKPGEFGVTGILGHNYLSGRAFFRLRKGDEVLLVYGGGGQARYRVSSIQHYQALSPHDVRSDFLDLNGPGGGTLSYAQLFQRVYTAPGTLVFQTCIEANGELSWGRIFIIAEPVTAYSGLPLAA